MPIFLNRRDLDGAVALRLHDRALTTAPVLRGATLGCGPRALDPYFLPSANVVGGISRRPPRAPYGRAFFVDAVTGAHAAIVDRATCRGAVARYRPGPLYAP